MRRSVCAGGRLAPRRRDLQCETRYCCCYYYYCTKLRVSVFVNRHRRRRRCTATTPRLHKSRGTATAAASMALSPRAPVPPTGRDRWHPGRPIDRLAVQWEGVFHYSLSRSLATLRRPTHNTLTGITSRSRFHSLRRRDVARRRRLADGDTDNNIEAPHLYTCGNAIVDVATRPPRPPVLSTFKSHKVGRGYNARRIYTRMPPKTRRPSALQPHIICRHHIIYATACLHILYCIPTLAPLHYVSYR